MEVVEGLNRKRSRSVIEVGASHAVVKSSLCYPTSMSLRFGARDLLLRSHGKCVCGIANYDAVSYYIGLCLRFKVRFPDRSKCLFNLQVFVSEFCMYNM